MDPDYFRSSFSDMFVLPFGIEALYFRCPLPNGSLEAAYDHRRSIL